MHDQTGESLRKQALKHGSKTVSKKALSKQSSLAPSRATSRANSPAPSRNVSAGDSRAGSDMGSNSPSDEDSRPTSPSAIDALIAEEQVPSNETWQEHLADIIQKIEDRNWKTSNVQTRKEALAAYVGLLRQHFCEEEIRFRLDQLTAAFVRCIKSEDDTLEAVLALKALAVTVITAPSSEIYESIYTTLKRAIIDFSDLRVKTEAIRTFAVASFYGDLSEDEIHDNLAFLLEIISSDGQYIDALDEPEPVAAALEAHGFLATLVDDFAMTSTEALEVFTDQLDSSSAAVLIAAGDNIALLYEKAYTPLEEEESAEDFAASDVLAMEDPNGGRNTTYFIRRYALATNQHQLESRLASIQSHSGKAMSREDKRLVHASFADILHSVQNPTHGPRFSTTVDPDTGREAGSSLKLKLAGKKSQVAATIDKWWLLHRHRALRAALAGGFMAHYEVNEGIFGAVPVVFVGVGRSGKKRRDRGGKGQFLEVLG